MNSASGFGPNTVVVIDIEQIFCANFSGVRFTGCIRGYDGSAPASHNAGATVDARILPSFHNNLVDEVQALETELGAGLTNVAKVNRLVDSKWIQLDAIAGNNLMGLHINSGGGGGAGDTGYMFFNPTGNLSAGGWQIASPFDGNPNFVFQRVTTSGEYQTSFYVTESENRLVVPTNNNNAPHFHSSDSAEENQDLRLGTLTGEPDTYLISVNTSDVSGYYGDLAKIKFNRDTTDFQITRGNGGIDEVNEIAVMKVVSINDGRSEILVIGDENQAARLNLMRNAGLSGCFFIENTEIGEFQLSNCSPTSVLRVNNDLEMAIGKETSGTTGFDLLIKDSAVSGATNVKISPGAAQSGTALLHFDDGTNVKHAIFPDGVLGLSSTSGIVFYDGAALTSAARQLFITRYDSERLAIYNSDINAFRGLKVKAAVAADDALTFGGGATPDADDCAKFDSSGRIVGAGAACGSGGGSSGTGATEPNKSFSVSGDDQLVITNAQHTYAHDNLFVYCKSTSTGVHVTPEQETIDPSTYTVTVDFSTNGNYTCTVNGWGGGTLHNKEYTVASSASLVVAGTTHDFLDSNIIVDCFTNVNPRVRLLDTDYLVSINTGNNDVTVTFDASGNYVCTLNGTIAEGGSGGGTSDHSALTNLGYGASGHTGFAPSTLTLTAGAGLTGGGDLTANRAFAIDIPGLTATGSPSAANDYVMIYSASAGALRKVLITNMPGGGGGGSPSGSGTEVQFRAGSSTFGAWGLSSVSGNILSYTGKIDAGSGILEIPNGTLPGTCAVGELFLNQNVTSGKRIYGCESTNTWVPQGDGNDGGGGGGAPTGAEYIVGAANATLTNEYIAQAGVGLTITKSSPNIRWDVDCTYVGCQGDHGDYTGNNKFSIGTEYLSWNIPNATSTGTTVNKLVTWTSANPIKALLAATSETKILGICVDDCGTTGIPRIAFRGRALCAFDGVPTAGDYVQSSSSSAGSCNSTATRPTTRMVGVVYSSTSVGGLYEVILTIP